MRIIETRQGLEPGVPSVLVPTMGALHAGHDGLFDLARALADEAGAQVIASVFVNPAQFNERGDFDAYPRTLEEDAARCEARGVDIVFAPTVEVMYPEGEGVEVPPLPQIATQPGLEDRYRPGHFPGVCKVCKRLFEITGCEQAVFGEKDWQQLQTVAAMVKGLGMPVRSVGGATVREPDGLAMSSRNVHLDASTRGQATSLVQAMQEAGRHDDPFEAERAGLEVLERAGVGTEYLAVRDAQTLGPVREGEQARVLVAARVGVTRLIDNAPWPGFTL